MSARRLITGLVYVTLASGASAQSPSFEVASIKVNPDAVQPGRATFPPGGVSFPNFSLQNLIGFAYGGTPGQPMEVTGGPEWVAKDRYVLIAKTQGSPGQPAIRDMMKTLLAERFKLKTHTEKKEVDVYAMVLARSDGKLGPNVHPFEGECAPPATPCPALINPSQGLNLGGQPMSTLATLLSASVTGLGRRVVDRTGLTGRYNMTLEYPFNAQAAAGGAPDQLGPSLFSVLQEQIGVKLEPAKGIVTVLVIDSADRPTEN
jgi:uncharacterized protein (TIGR03435 family)